MPESDAVNTILETIRAHADEEGEIEEARLLDLSGLPWSVAGAAIEQAVKADLVFCEPWSPQEGIFFSLAPAGERLLAEGSGE